MVFFSDSHIQTSVGSMKANNFEVNYVDDYEVTVIQVSSNLYKG